MRGELKAQDAILIPLGQALVTGGMVGIVAGSCAALAGLPSSPIIGLGVFGAASLASWLNYRSEWVRRTNALAGIHEELEARRVEASTIRVEVLSDNLRAGEFLDLPGGQERLISLASGLLAGKPFTCREWSRLYSPSEFSQMRSELVARNLAEWRSPHDHRSGAELTKAGMAVMRYLSRYPLTHSTHHRLQLLKSLGEKTDTHTNTGGLSRG